VSLCVAGTLRRAAFPPLFLFLQLQLLSVCAETVALKMHFSQQREHIRCLQSSLRAAIDLHPLHLRPLSARVNPLSYLAVGVATWPFAQCFLKIPGRSARNPWPETRVNCRGSSFEKDAPLMVHCVRGRGFACSGNEQTPRRTVRRVTQVGRMAGQPARPWTFGSARRVPGACCVSWS
jgi:hypothetical protein